MTAGAMQASFAGGELAPALAARIDLAKFHTGAKLLDNFIVHAHGGVSNRPGFQLVHLLGEDVVAARLIDFQFSAEQTYVLAFTDRALLIVKEGGLVLRPAGSDAEGQPVQVVTPYRADDLAGLRVTQSADVMTIVHPDHPVMELRRLDHHRWDLVAVAFEPSLSPPTALAATADHTEQATDTYTYVVTAVAENLEESVACDPVSVTSTKLGTPLGESPSYVYPTITLTWAPADKAVKYNVYCARNGIFGWIGATEGLSFKDDNIKPDLGDTPPRAKNPFAAAGAYPGAVAHHEQRRVFAASSERPLTIWFSQTSNHGNFSGSEPARDDDAIEVTIAARRINAIRHLVPMSSLIVLTNGGEWVLSSGARGEPLSPTAIRLDPQGYRGAADVAPLVIGDTVLFVQAQGSTVRDLGYTYETDGWRGNDLSVLASHLFEGRRIIDWAYAQTPHSIVWAVRDDGKLLALTYMREHEVWAWSRHSTDGDVLAVSTVAEGREDVLYAVVRRTIGGARRLCIERMAGRAFDDQADAFFVDCGLSYHGAPTTRLTGLDHLEGRTTAILADGAVHRQLTVAGGMVELDWPASTIHVGLPYVAELKTLDSMDQGGGGTLQGRRKRVVAVLLRLLAARGIWVGPEGGRLDEIKLRTTEPMGAAPLPVTEDVRVQIEPLWGRAPSVHLQVRDPVPATILGVMPELAVGD